MAATTTANNVERLRSETIQIEPLLLDRVFEDPAAVISIIEERAPYATLAEYHGFDASSFYGGDVVPWFRASFDDAFFLEHPQWVEGARQAFGASIVRPLRCLINIQPPVPAGAAHTDLPTFRGSNTWPPEVWLLMSMGCSGLFAPWQVPVAAGLAWFYRGEGGEFEYWPEGPARPSRCQGPPLWNVGQISDNDYMWHRVGAIGRPEAILPRGTLRPEAKLHHVQGSSWEIRDGSEVKARYNFDELRISLLWKAYVFEDEGQLASFKNHDADLDLEQVVDIFCEDLSRRGVRFERPIDPLHDPAWQKVIEETYPVVFVTD